MGDWIVGRFKGGGVGWRTGPGKKRGGAFSPIFEDRVHAMTLPIFKTPKQKKKKKISK